MVLFIRIQKLDAEDRLSVLFPDPSNLPNEDFIVPNLVQILQLASNQKAVVNINWEDLIRSEMDAGAGIGDITHQAGKTDRVGRDLDAELFVRGNT